MEHEKLTTTEESWDLLAMEEATQESENPGDTPTEEGLLPAGHAAAATAEQAPETDHVAEDNGALENAIAEALDDTAVQVKSYPNSPNMSITNSILSGCPRHSATQSYLPGSRHPLLGQPECHPPPALPPGNTR